MSDLVYLYIAYTVIWLGVFVYMVYLHGRQAELKKELEILTGRVKRDGAGKQ
jgi:CcmD family protein